jgi:hydrogenase/urease accessory protein HupE
MQMKLRKCVWGILTPIAGVSIASAHPGHAPTDLAAQVSQPLAGVDHFVAFAALTAVLLVAFRFALKIRSGQSTKLQDPNSR